MIFNADKKNIVSSLSIHVELIMWGDDFLNIEMNNADEPEVSWFSICEGGDISEKGTKKMDKGTYSKIIDFLFSIDFPEQEYSETNQSWEIQCADANGNEVASTGFGNWDKNVLTTIVNYIAEMLNDKEPTNNIMNTIRA